MKGEREHILFLYRIHQLYVTEDKDRALEAVLELNSRFIQPLREREAIKATRSAESSKYNYKNGTIIELLEITQEEQQYMQTIISKRVKYDRSNKKEKLKRRNDEGLTQREQAKIDNFNQVKELYEQGLKQVKIVEMTGLSKEYVSKTIKRIKE